MTFSMQNFSISLCSTPSACWVEMTTLTMRVGLAIDILHGDLALGIGAEPLGLAALADGGEGRSNTVGIHDRSGHQFGGFITGITKHDTLVAGSLLGGFFAFGFFGIHSLGDIRTLGGEDVLDKNFVSVENVVIIHVADFTDGVTDDLNVIELGLGGDFATDDGDVAFHIGFAGNAAVGILFEASIQNGVRNGVRDFVGMAFADGFG